MKTEEKNNNGVQSAIKTEPFRVTEEESDSKEMRFAENELVTHD